MFSSKVGLNLLRRLAANRVCRRSAENVAAVVRRHYIDGGGGGGGGGDGDDDDVKFVESDKYKVFKDDESSVILDVEEERALLHSRRGDERLEYDEIDQFAGFDTSRGVSGVYEVEHLVEALRKNNVSDVFVVSVPVDVRYVDYIVVATGKSQKHLMSVIEFVHRLFKRKKRPTDGVPRIVNAKPVDWLALDLGNIALHLMTKETRKKIDLETIWSVGEKFDSHLNRPADSLVTLLNEHSFSLDGFEPVDIINSHKTR